MAESSKKSVIAIPFGWKRSVLNKINDSDSHVIYTSPSGVILSSISEICQYLESNKTCKCGLQCPIHVTKVFNFNPKVCGKVLSRDEWKKTKDVGLNNSSTCLHWKKLYHQQFAKKGKHEEPNVEPPPKLIIIRKDGQLTSVIPNKNRAETKNSEASVSAAIDSPIQSCSTETFKPKLGEKNNFKLQWIKADDEFSCNEDKKCENTLYSGRFGSGQLSFLSPSQSPIGMHTDLPYRFGVTTFPGSFLGQQNEQVFDKNKSFYQFQRPLFGDQHSMGQNQQGNLYPNPFGALPTIQSKTKNFAQKRPMTFPEIPAQWINVEELQTQPGFAKSEFHSWKPMGKQFPQGTLFSPPQGNLPGGSRATCGATSSQFGGSSGESNKRAVVQHQLETSPLSGAHWQKGKNPGATNFFGDHNANNQWPQMVNNSGFNKGLEGMRSPFGPKEGQVAYGPRSHNVISPRLPSSTSFFQNISPRNVTHQRFPRFPFNQSNFASVGSVPHFGSNIDPPKAPMGGQNFLVGNRPSSLLHQNVNNPNPMLDETGPVRMKPVTHVAKSCSKLQSQVPFNFQPNLVNSTPRMSAGTATSAASKVRRRKSVTTRDVSKQERGKPASLGRNFSSTIPEHNIQSLPKDVAVFRSQMVGFSQSNMAVYSKDSSPGQVGGIPLKQSHINPQYLSSLQSSKSSVQCSSSNSFIADRFSVASTPEKLCNPLANQTRMCAPLIKNTAAVDGTFQSQLVTSPHTPTLLPKLSLSSEPGYPFTSRTMSGTALSWESYNKPVTSKNFAKSTSTSEMSKNADISVNHCQPLTCEVANSSSPLLKRQQSSSHIASTSLISSGGKVFVEPPHKGRPATFENTTFSDTNLVKSSLKLYPEKDIRCLGQQKRFSTSCGNSFSKDETNYAIQSENPESKSVENDDHDEDNQVRPTETLQRSTNPMSTMKGSSQVQDEEIARSVTNQVGCGIPQDHTFTSRSSQVRTKVKCHSEGQSSGLELISDSRRAQQSNEQEHTDFCNNENDNKPQTSKSVSAEVNDCSKSLVTEVKVANKDINNPAKSVSYSAPTAFGTSNLTDTVIQQLSNYNTILKNLIVSGKADPALLTQLNELNPPQMNELNENQIKRSVQSPAPSFDISDNAQSSNDNQHKLDAKTSGTSGDAEASFSSTMSEKNVEKELIPPGSCHLSPLLPVSSHTSNIPVEDKKLSQNRVSSHGLQVPIVSSSVKNSNGKEEEEQDVIGPLDLATTHQEVSTSLSVNEVKTKPGPARRKTKKSQLAENRRASRSRNALLKCGDLVWGQMRGFPSWPGKIVRATEVKGIHQRAPLPDGKVWVKWFGDYTFTQMNPMELRSMTEGLEAHHKSRKRGRTRNRKLNNNLELAIQEAVDELEVQQNQKQPRKGMPSETSKARGKKRKAT